MFCRIFYKICYMKYLFILFLLFLTPDLMGQDTYHKYVAKFYSRIDSTRKLQCCDSNYRGFSLTYDIPLLELPYEKLDLEDYEKRNLDVNLSQVAACLDTIDNSGPCKFHVLLNRVSLQIFFYKGSFCPSTISNRLNWPM